VIAIPNIKTGSVKRVNFILKRSLEEFLSCLERDEPKDVPFKLMRMLCKLSKELELQEESLQRLKDLSSRLKLMITETLKSPSDLIPSYDFIEGTLERYYNQLNFYNEAYTDQDIKFWTDVVITKDEVEKFKIYKGKELFLTRGSVYPVIDKNSCFVGDRLWVSNNQEIAGFSHNYDKNSAEVNNTKAKITIKLPPTRQLQTLAHGPFLIIYDKSNSTFPVKCFKEGILIWEKVFDCFKEIISAPEIDKIVIVAPMLEKVHYLNPLDGETVHSLDQYVCHRNLLFCDKYFIGDNLDDTFDIYSIDFNLIKTVTNEEVCGLKNGFVRMRHEGRVIRFF
jgi:hypothetical protein